MRYIAVLFFLVAGRFVAAQAQRPNVASLSESATRALAAGAEAMHKGDYAAAEGFFRSVTIANPRFAEGFMNLGVAQQQRSLLSDARKSLITAADLKPKLMGVHFVLGLVDYQINLLSEAQSAFRMETALAPRNALAWMWLGVVDMDLGRLEESRSSLDRAREIDARNVDILFHLGRVYMLLSQDSYEKMFALDPDSARVHQVLAQADAGAAKRQEAVAEYLKAIVKAPMLPGLHEELAGQYWDLGRLDEADSEYREELKITPEDPVVLFKLGALRVQRNQSQSGIPLLRQAMQLQPSLTDAFYLLGTGEAQEDDFDHAVADLGRAAESDSHPENRQSAYYRLFQLFKRHGRGSEARVALARFTAMKKQNDQSAQSRIAEKRKRTDLPGKEPLSKDSTE